MGMRQEDHGSGSSEKWWLLTTVNSRGPEMAKGILGVSYLNYKVTLFVGPSPIMETVKGDVICTEIARKDGILN